MVRRILSFLVCIGACSYAQAPDLSSYTPLSITSDYARIIRSKKHHDLFYVIYYGNVHITAQSGLKARADKVGVIAEHVNQVKIIYRKVLVQGSVKIQAQASTKMSYSSECSRAILDLKTYSVTLIGTEHQSVMSTVNLSHT